MSGKTQECVWEHSPYTLGKRLVHLAVADMTAEDYGNYLWATQDTVGRRARVERPTVNSALNTMVDDGWLIRVEWDGLPPAVRAMVNDKRVRFFRVMLCGPCSRHWNLPEMCKKSDTSPDAMCSIEEDDVFDSSTRRVRSADSSPITNQKEQEDPEISRATFDDFWSAYPKRDGKRLFRGKAEPYWKKMTEPQREATLVGARHFANAIERGLFFGVPDPFRWLRDKGWLDWQEPAAEGASGPPKGKGGGTSALHERIRREDYGQA